MIFNLKPPQAGQAGLDVPTVSACLPLPSPLSSSLLLSRRRYRESALTTVQYFLPPPSILSTSAEAREKRRELRLHTLLCGKKNKTFFLVTN